MKLNSECGDVFMLIFFGKVKNAEKLYNTYHETITCNHHYRRNTYFQRSSYHFMLYTSPYTQARAGDNINNSYF